MQYSTYSDRTTTTGSVWPFGELDAHSKMKGSPSMTRTRADEYHEYMWDRIGFKASRNINARAKKAKDRVEQFPDPGTFDEWLAKRQAERRERRGEQPCIECGAIRGRAPDAGTPND